MAEEESDELYLGRLGTVTQKGSRTRKSCRMMVQQAGQVEGPSGGSFQAERKTCAKPERPRTTPSYCVLGTENTSVLKCKEQGR